MAHSIEQKILNIQCSPDSNIKRLHSGSLGHGGGTRSGIDILGHIAASGGLVGNLLRVLLRVLFRHVLLGLSVAVEVEYAHAGVLASHIRGGHNGVGVEHKRVPLHGRRRGILVAVGVGVRVGVRTGRHLVHGRGRVLRVVLRGGLGGGGARVRGRGGRVGDGRGRGVRDGRDGLGRGADGLERVCERARCGLWAPGRGVRRRRGGLLGVRLGRAPVEQGALGRDGRRGGGRVRRGAEVGAVVLARVDVDCVAV